MLEIAFFKAPKSIAINPVVTVLAIILNTSLLPKNLFTALNLVFDNFSNILNLDILSKCALRSKLLTLLQTLLVGFSIDSISISSPFSSCSSKILA